MKKLRLPDSPNDPERLATIVLTMQEKHPRPIVHFKRRYYFARDNQRGFVESVARRGEIKRLIQANFLVRIRRRFYLTPVGLGWLEGFGGSAEELQKKLVERLQKEIDQQLEEEAEERRRG